MAKARLTRGGRKLRVLVVEDHALIALDLQMMIGELGGEVLAIVTSGERAVGLARELRPDLVLMDVRLAGVIDGIDAATAVADVPGTALIFVTANSDPATLRRMERLDSVRVVPKPVLANELMAAIGEVCRLDHAPQPCAAAVWQISALPRAARRARGAAGRRDVPESAIAPPAFQIERLHVQRERARELRARLIAQCAALQAMRRELGACRAARLAARVARRCSF